MRLLPGGPRVLVGAIALLIAACGSAPPPSSAPPSATSAPVSTPVATATAPPAASPSPSPTASPGVPYDAALLAVLPATIAGLDVIPTPEIAEELGADPQLQQISDGFAAGIVSDPATGELAVVMLVRLRDGVFADEFFRDYRDSFDAEACAPAGGLVGNAEAEIGGHQTFIATCVNGARTYHVHADDPDMLVSVTAASETLRLGEQVVEALPD
jgi:hypothetical protein